MKRVSNRLSKRSSTRQTKDFNDYDELGNAVDDNVTLETQDMLRNIFMKSKSDSLNKIILFSQKGRAHKGLTRRN